MHQNARRHVSQTQQEAWNVENEDVKKTLVIENRANR